jgi:hypothetical protein
MAGKHEIELFISDDGELKVHIKGIKGPGCLKVLDSLVKEMGVENERTLTGEYYETPLAQDKPQTKIKKENPA